MTEADTAQPLLGRVAVITGGARGQGRSHALELARLGADVAICDLCEDVATIGYPLSTRDDLAETAKLVDAADRRSVSEVVDVRDLGAVIAFVDEAIHPTTPQYGHRLVKPIELKKYLKSKWGAEGYDRVEARCKNPTTAAGVPQTMRLWIDMATASGQSRYTRSNLKAVGFAPHIVDEIIDTAYGYGYTTVNSPITADREGPSGRFSAPGSEPSPRTALTTCSIPH